MVSMAIFNPNAQGPETSGGSVKSAVRRVLEWAAFLGTFAVLIVWLSWGSDYYLEKADGTSKLMSFTPEQVNNITEFVLEECSSGWCDRLNPMDQHHFTMVVVKRVENLYFNTARSKVIPKGSDDRNLISSVIIYSLYLMYNKEIALCVSAARDIYKKLKNSGVDANELFGATINNLKDETPGHPPIHCSFLASALTRKVPDASKVNFDFHVGLRRLSNLDHSLAIAHDERIVKVR